MNDYGSYSYWLESAGEPLDPRPALARSQTVDVAILGAGYTGLWTAYYLLRAKPDRKVAILEKEIAGFGASGRNGGWCSSRFPVTPVVLKARFGTDAARQMALAMFHSVEEVGRICEEEQIDADFYRGGILSLARGKHQLPAIRATYSGYKQLGLADRFQMLSAEEARERVNATRIEGGLFTPEGASLHPGRLVRGLARAVDRRGGVIYEKTEVIEYLPGSTPKLITRAGEVIAKEAVVLAGEAYLTRLRKMHRSLLPVYSLITITEPLSEAHWKEIGWQGRESMASNKYTVDYLTRTADGRILFGSRGAPYAFGSKITDEQDRHAETHKQIQRSLLEWFPVLRGVKFTHSWGGPVGMPRDWMPTVTFDEKSRIALAAGYTGQGVSTANLAGRILSRFISGRRDELTALALARRKSPQWEMEPLRWMTVRFIQNSLTRLDEALEEGRIRPPGSRIAERLAKH
jgi:glycine/D-amino acid oxidase-like deaminating enzyme